MILDKIRYALALVMLVTMPAALLYWYLIHPLAHLWRRLPTWATYTVVTVLIAPVGVLVYSVHERLLAVDYGFSWPLTAVGIVLYALAAWLEVLCRRHLELRILVGVPEVSPGGGPGKLLTEGIYARSRNPRYLDLWLALLAFALFTNFRAMYLLWLATIPGIWLLVLLEERELRQRFGAEYVEYCRRVPRFLPRWRAG